MVPSPADRRHHSKDLPNPGGKWRWDNDEGWNPRPEAIDPAASSDPEFRRGVPAPARGLEISGPQGVGWQPIQGHPRKIYTSRNRAGSTGATLQPGDRPGRNDEPLLQGSCQTPAVAGIAKGTQNERPQCSARQGPGWHRPHSAAQRSRSGGPTAKAEVTAETPDKRSSQAGGLLIGVVVLGSAAQIPARCSAATAVVTQGGMS